VKYLTHAIVTVSEAFIEYDTHALHVRGWDLLSWLSRRKAVREQSIIVPPIELTSSGYNARYSPPSTRILAVIGASAFSSRCHESDSRTGRGRLVRKGSWWRAFARNSVGTRFHVVRSISSEANTCVIRRAAPRDFYCALYTPELP